MFERAGLIARAIECYEKAEAWEQLLHCLYKSNNCFRASEFESLQRKFVPIALNKLYLILSGEEKIKE